MGIQNILAILMLAITGVIMETNLTLTEEELDDYFRAVEIVPDILPHAPVTVLSVKFMEKDVNFGNRLGVLDTLLSPKVSWNDTEEDATPDSLYTLMFVTSHISALVETGPQNRVMTFTDVDGGNPHFLNWMVNNIYGGDLNNSTVTLDYVYPNPPEGTLPYRMVLLLYRQPGKDPYSYEKSIFLGSDVDRSSFDIMGFVEMYNFSMYPPAGNYFMQYPRLGKWHPRNPPEWMIPFLPELDGHPPLYMDTN